MSTDVVREGEELITRWRNSVKQKQNVLDNLTKANRELQTSEEKLAMWLLPKDALEGEKFCIWYGDSLISVQENEAGYIVEIRKRGKSLSV